MKLFTFLFFLMVMMTEINCAQNPPTVEPGVSQTLAKWRAANYSDVRYKLNITLEKQAPLMKGEIEIRVKLTEEGAKNDLILDWRTTQFANDKDKPYANVVGVNDAAEILSSETNEHIRIPKGLLKMGENVIKIQFASPIKTSGAAITRYVDKEDGAEYVYSLFVPSDASTAFPVFDQPDLKARFNLEVVAPESWKVVSNANVWAEDVKFLNPTNRKEVNFPPKGMSLTLFEETEPISTYVFAFTAGNFAEFEDKNTSTTSRESGDTKVARRETSGKQINDSRVEDAQRNESARISNARNNTDLSRRFTSGYSLDASSTQKTEPQTAKIYVRKSQAEKFKAHEKEVFRLNREAVKNLESYFDYKFPFPKYDLVLIPEFPFGGMEHAGATFLREASIIFPSEPTKNDYISRANLIFHEAAHQWFGDTVTMKWFDDLWLKEGFAEFMAYKTLEKVMPEYNAWKAFYERNKPLAYLTDSTKGTTPIYQEIPNLSAAKSAYGNIVYRKAPAFLRQAEFYLGEKEFQTAVRAFLKKHEYANAEWTDLVAEFGNAAGKEFKEKSGVEVQVWAQDWVKQRGLPIVRVKEGDLRMYRTQEDIEKNGGGMHDTAQTYWFEQSDAIGENKIWNSNVNVLMRFRDGKSEIKNTTIRQAKNSQFATFWVIAAGRSNNEIQTPTFVFPNYQDYGYGIFLLDEQSRDYVLKNIQSEKDDFLRSMMWGTLWDSVRESELDPQDYVELAIKNIAVEQDESTIQAILSRVGTALNYYIPNAAELQITDSKLQNNPKSKIQNPKSNDLIARLEAVLTERIANAATPGQRITFYRAYLNLASSAQARQNLRDILAGKSKLAVFQLRTKDKFDLVTRLLILGDASAPNLLANLEKTETSDDAKRYAYAARAGIGTIDAKAKYFRDFMTNKQISESWIEAAFVPFNSAKHSDLTLQYLETALAELSNLKRTRKIFFVNGWLGAFIGGQKSEEALATVNRFLADSPNLDKDLRLKILENSDNLERAVKIRGKYGK